MILFIIICAVLIGITGSFLPLLIMLAIGVPLGILMGVIESSDNKKKRRK